MAFPGVKDLCTPAFVYLMLSMIALVIIAFQNVFKSNEYCIGDFSCGVSSILLVFIFKVIYILFWTWILHLMCNAGYKSIAWFFVLFPFILFFVIIALFLLKYQ